MSTQLVTNQEALVEDVINNILPKSDSADFLVGYFYFSGFERLYLELKDKKLRILVGMDIEKGIRNKVKEFELLEAVNTSRGDIRDKFYRSFIEICNDTDFFDSRERIEAFEVYIGKIKDGSLEIRKTFEPNHAKLYLFQYNDYVNERGNNPGAMITGSSNLTYSGMAGRQEVNVVMRGKDDYLKGRAIFDTLWEKAVNIASADNWPDFEKQLIEKVWINNLYPPFLMYVRVLDELFSKKKEKNIRYPAEITGDSFYNLKYQMDAVDSAVSIIKKHGGVIISDVVGLGKSIVASVVANNMGLHTVIIAPPHLKDQWITYEYEFRFNARIYSSGNIKKALENHEDDRKEKLIIIDEAHKYRNEATESYGLLHRLCQGNKVILLTATPFNNRPQDIFSMIKLFQVPAKSTLQVVENLILEFKKLIKEYKDILKIQRDQSQPEEKIDELIKKLANEIRNILSPLLIRRTRLDLMEIDGYRRDLERQNISFPRVLDPIDSEYDLGDLSELYVDTLEKIAPKDEASGFRGTRYKPVVYLKDFQKYKDRISREFGEEQLFKQAQINVARFMRRLLVSRYESSVYAFGKTLDYMIESTKIMIRWFDEAKQVPIFKKGYIPDVANVVPDDDSMFGDELWDDIIERNILVLRNKGYEFIPANELKVSFKKDMLKDLELLEGIRDRWFNGPHQTDPKLEHFVAILNRKLRNEPHRKLVVFSSYADTANYLFEKLDGQFKVFKYSSADASDANKKIIKQNFDASWKIQTDEFDILIATDAISEGYNLHRAGAIFNYDIPYNPTRVIQRVGRINRINKKVFDELYIYNFFPTTIGEKEVGIKRISTLKKAMIDALLGEDTKILTSDEELESYFTEEIRKQMANQEELSWDTPYIKLLDQLKSEQEDVVDAARKIPTRARVRRSEQKNVSGVLLFGRKGEDHLFKYGDNTGKIITVPANEALEFFQAQPGEEPNPVSPGFEPIYQNVKKHLFHRKTQVPVDKGKREARDKIRVILNLLPNSRDYLEDLNTVVSALDGLPERFLRMIRGISADNLEEDFEEFKQAVPHQYLINIIDKARKVEEGEEFLILSEELI
jgi:superfamily II DNA or RNA helicase